MARSRQVVRDLRSLVGDELAGFRITRLIGEGGMAAVFRAESILNSRVVRALKVVRPELGSRPEFWKRFSREAVVLQKLRHPAVVMFYGLRRFGDLLMMELELLEGRPLSSKRGRPAPVTSAIQWILEASEGVAAAHALNVVHGDLKPANLFLTKGGKVKVLDFGIARVIDDADRASHASAAGKPVGSPRYMAPEVCEGAAPTPAADVYALGLSLYELLLGFHPLEPLHEPKKSSVELMDAQVHAALDPIREYRADVPELLERVIARSTSKTAAERYPDAGAFADALEPLMANLPAKPAEP